MNNLFFYSCISSYQKFALEALHDSPQYWNPLEYRTWEAASKIFLSIPVYLVNGVLFLVGRAISVLTTDFWSPPTKYEPRFPYSDLGSKALVFATQKVQEHYPEIPQLSEPTSLHTPWYESSAFKQPTNPEITRLAVLYESYKRDFFQTLENNPEDSWNKESVIEAADACMKMAFAVSARTLDDLESFNQYLTTNGLPRRTPEEALVRQDSYQFKTFYDCTQMYHWIRGGIFYKGRGLVCSDDLLSPHLALFYESGTKQNMWNMLYNEYCDRVRLYVSEDELHQRDERHVNWTQRDIGPETFCVRPDTIPT